nr:ArsR family transcriptional regulator [Streptomyces megasporus]
MPPRPGTEPAAAAAEAPADPTRLSVAAALAEGGELCVCDLARTSGPGRNLVSHHLRRPRGGAGRLPPGGPAGVSRAHRPRPCSGQGRPQPGPGRTP